MYDEMYNELYVLTHMLTRSLKHAASLSLRVVRFLEERYDSDELSHALVSSVLFESDANSGGEPDEAIELARRIHETSERLLSEADLSGNGILSVCEKWRQVSVDEMDSFRGRIEEQNTRIHSLRLDVDKLVESYGDVFDDSIDKSLASDLKKSLEDAESTSDKIREVIEHLGYRTAACAAYAEAPQWLNASDGESDDDDAAYDTARSDESSQTLSDSEIYDLPYSTSEAVPSHPSCYDADQAAPSCPDPSVARTKMSGLLERVKDRIASATSRRKDVVPVPTVAPQASAAVEGNDACPTLDSVQFAVVLPKKTMRMNYSTIDIVMYEDGWERAVDNVAEEHDGPVKTVKSGWTEARRGTNVLVRLDSPDLGHIGEREGTWHGRYLRFGFAVKVPKDFPDDEVLLNASVYFDGVPSTHLSFVLSVGKGSGGAVSVERRDVSSAFISYASTDRGRVAVIVQGIEAIRPDLDVFLDVESLRSGDDWKRILDEEIRERDVLFLCWSRAARESDWVDYEWRCAYADKGIGGIEPVAIEPPEICPPPEELKSKHFNSRLLYIANATEKKTWEKL